jgi:hypothetical protein
MHICHFSQSDICLRRIHTRRGCKCHPPCITKFICVLASGKSYTGRCSYVCARISTMSERATTHAAQFHSLTQLNIMQHISRKHSERARNNDSALSRVILRGLDSPFFCRRTYTCFHILLTCRGAQPVFCV